MRPLVRYDLDEPPTVTPFADLHRPPAKKRKRNRRNPQRHPSQQSYLQHWDDPGTGAFGMAYDEQECNTTSTSIPHTAEHGEEVAEGDEPIGAEQEGQGEGSPLTHEEIWDDSPLIDAWNSAEAEYEAFHGTSKAWKREPVKKSSLWHKTPVPQPSHEPTQKKRARQEQEDDEPEPDTAPFDFYSYIPTHDPSLGIPSDATTVDSPPLVPSPSSTMVSQDEAFNNALNAMYWVGYWTGVYHTQGQTSVKDIAEQGKASEESGIKEDDDEDEEDLVPAQR